jgi:hypothetical protein
LYKITSFFKSCFLPSFDTGPPPKKSSTNGMIRFYGRLE